MQTGTLEPSVKERPILMSAPMVKAILEGRKTQTRRIMKPQPPEGATLPGVIQQPAYGGANCVFKVPVNSPVLRHNCKYGARGDRLWIRETAYIAPPNFGDADLNNCRDNEGRGRLVGYCASMSGDAERCAEDYGVKKSPSIFMPRWASRITLEIKSVRVERLQEMSEADAKAEGCFPEFEIDLATFVHGAGFDAKKASTYYLGYKHLWNEINGAGSWDLNPFVWVIEFDRFAAAGQAPLLEV